MIRSTAFSISLSAKTTKGDLSPSSRLMRFISFAPAALMREATGPDPVKAILSTCGCSTKAALTFI